MIGKSHCAIRVKCDVPLFTGPLSHSLSFFLSFLSFFFYSVVKYISPYYATGVRESIKRGRIRGETETEREKERERANEERERERESSVNAILAPEHKN